MGLLDQQKEGLLPVTSNPKMLAQALKARQTTPRTQLTGQGLLDTAAIGLSPVPVIGDALGLAADASRFYNEPESRTPLNFGLAALGAIPFIPPLVSAGLGKFAQSQGKQLAAPPTGPARNQAGAIVYHGSPHKFDAFDSSKIGTGEGAQAYGHGLYFAENPAVANQYQKNLSGYPEIDGKRISGGLVDKNSTPEDIARILLAPIQNADDLARVREEAKSFMGGVAAPVIDNLVASGKLKFGQPGSLYKVDLPDEAIAKMLDWDKPLSQQSKEVQKALEKTKNKQLRAIVDYASSPYTTAGLEGEVKTMGEAIKLLGMNASPAKGSQLLAKQGIPGIRYLDGGSRNAGEGTRNFVVFPGNEGLLKILERQ